MCSGDRPFCKVQKQKNTIRLRRKIHWVHFPNCQVSDTATGIKYTQLFSGGREIAFLNQTNDHLRLCGIPYSQQLVCDRVNLLLLKWTGRTYPCLGGDASTGIEQHLNDVCVTWPCRGVHWSQPITSSGVKLSPLIDQQLGHFWFAPLCCQVERRYAVL